MRQAEQIHEAASVSAVILTHNEASNIEACLDSLEGWVKEIHVVDSGSTDGTPAICRSRGAVVHEHPFNNYSEQRNWAIDHLNLAGDWELHVDADERVTPDLRQSILEAVRRNDAQVAGFIMSRRTVFMGRPILHGGHYPAFHLRLFRRGTGRCENRSYDQHFVVRGKTQRLHADLIDTITSDLGTWVERHNRWAALEAAELLQDGRFGEVDPRVLGNPIERRRWLRKGYQRFPMFVRPFVYFFYRYILRFGFLDGLEGMIFHFLQGFWFRFLVDAKLYELKRKSNGSSHTGR